MKALGNPAGDDSDNWEFGAFGRTNTGDRKNRETGADDDEQTWAHVGTIPRIFDGAIRQAAKSRD